MLDFVQIIIEFVFRRSLPKILKILKKHPSLQINQNKDESSANNFAFDDRKENVLGVKVLQLDSPFCFSLILF